MIAEIINFMHIWGICKTSYPEFLTVREEKQVGGSLGVPRRAFRLYLLYVVTHRNERKCNEMSIRPRFETAKNHVCKNARISLHE